MITPPLFSNAFILFYFPFSFVSFSFSLVVVSFRVKVFFRVLEEIGEECSFFIDLNKMDVTFSLIQNN